MTRDEARFALQGPLGEHFGNKVPEGVDDAWLNCWVTLGMLKLDEPESAEQKFRTELAAYLTPQDIRSLMGWMEVVGLKIVEK